MHGSDLAIPFNFANCGDARRKSVRIERKAYEATEDLPREKHTLTGCRKAVLSPRAKEAGLRWLSS